MNITEVLSNETLRRTEFPVAREKIFLAHAGVCPLPFRVAKAVQDYAWLSTQGDQETLLPLMQIKETRELAARLMNAKAGEIAFVGPTSLALSYVAAGIDFKPGESVLIYFDDYPSNVYPWMALERKGVQVRFIPPGGPGKVTLAEIAPLVDSSTRLVALASCHYISGYRPNLKEIGAFLKERNILFCLDAIQTIGAFPCDVEQVDFLAADAHKWMLGPCAAGILFVRKEAQNQFQPPVYGWNNVRCPEFIAQEKLLFRPDAQRYEAGTHNLLGLAGLRAALLLLHEVGIGNIAAELLRKREWLAQELQRKGLTVLHREAPAENCSGIVTFFHPGRDMAALHQKLAEHQVITSLRTTRDQQRYIRLSPHFYNTESELVRLIELL
jgi:cysteine desulfurase / selenocysteine lyase